MPSTYTTNLGIEKIGTGEQSGTWGDTTNTNLDLIDEAVNGIIAITLSSAGSSGSPTALPITDGSSSNGRNKFIEFVDGGDLGGTAYVQLTPNNAEKIVHIRNSLSGSRSVIVFQGTYNASNDFEIASGADVLLKFSGGGSGATVTDVNVDLTVTGLTVTTADINGGTIDGVTLQASVADVDNIKLDGNTISSTDGNGNINLTPNGMGSVVISKVDVASGEIDGTAIGANVAATGDFTSLSASSGVDFTGATISDLGSVTTADINGGTIDGADITVGAGKTLSVINGTLTLADDQISGSKINGGVISNFRSTGIDDNATSTAITIDANENVGVGTTNPSAPLSVVAQAGIGYGQIKIRQYDAAQDQRSGVMFGEYVQGTQGYGVSSFASATENRLYLGGGVNGVNAATDIRFVTAASVGTNTGTERMRIDSSGNVLVGKTNTGQVNDGIAMQSDGATFITRGAGTPLTIRRSAAGAMIQFSRGGTSEGFIQMNTGAAPTLVAASDERLKDNIVDHESELANVMALRPVTWDWKDESRGTGEGFIAQELEQTAWADLVSEGDDGFKQVGGLGTVETRLIKAMQEQQAMIQDLKAEVAALKGA